MPYCQHHLNAFVHIFFPLRNYFIEGITFKSWFLLLSSRLYDVLCFSTRQEKNVHNEKYITSFLSTHIVYIQKYAFSVYIGKLWIISSINHILIYSTGSLTILTCDVTNFLWNSVYIFLVYSFLEIILRL